jgi:hypothetical protein
LKKPLQAYVSVYLKEEIAVEALVRKLSSFNPDQSLSPVSLCNIKVLGCSPKSKECLKSNRLYYAMLTSLGYGSVMKYLYSKVKYKMRIRRGYY